MKVLHTKSTTEPILLVSTCHNMNLFAVVTNSAVVIYRSTSPTVVATLPLRLAKTDKDVASLQGCWSPSGRLFTVTLPDGCVLLLDVESGDLVRQFVPVSLRRVMKSDECGVQNTSQQELVQSQSELVVDADKATGDDVEETALHRPVRMPISTDAAPVAACAWELVSSSGCHLYLEYKSRCLPLRTSISTAILEELEQPLRSPEEKQALAMLFVLDRRGTLSCILGGLQEVCIRQLRLPSVFPLGYGARIENFRIIPQRSAVNDSTESERPLFPLNQGGAGCTSTGDGRPHHVVCLAVSNRKNGHALHNVVGANLGASLTNAVEPYMVAMCCVAEHCRTARNCFLRVQKLWHQLLHWNIRPKLQLPEMAVLLCNAVMEEVAQPDEEALNEYYETLPREELVDGLEKLAETLSRIASNVYSVCYRCYDVALSIAQTQWPSFTAISIMPSKMHAAPFGGKGFLGFQHSQHRSQLAYTLGCMRRNCEFFLRRIQREGEHESELVRWVLHRAAIREGIRQSPNDNSVAAGEGRLPYSTEPLSVVRHPTLLRSLHRIVKNQSTAFADTVEEDADEAYETELHELLQAGLRNPTIETVVGSVLPLIDSQRLDGLLVDMTSLSSTCQEGDTSAKYSISGLHATTFTRFANQVPSFSQLCVYNLPVVAEWGDRTPCAQGISSVALDLKLLHSCIGDLHLQPVGFTKLKEGRHILVWQKGATNDGGDKSQSAEGGFVMAVLDDEGHVVVNEDPDEDDEDEDATLRAPLSQDGADDGLMGGAPAILDMKGLSTTGCLLTSVSKAREFCVVAAHNKFVVVDLYDV